jgi:DNA-binding IclR family transcriptional regulator
MQAEKEREMDETRNNSASLRRALSVLQALRRPTAAGTGLTLVQLAETLQMNKSTLLRLLRPLRDFDLVAQTADGRYRIGVGAVALGDSYVAGLDLRAAARPTLERLVEKAGETTHLLVYSRGEMVYVDKVDGPSTVRMASRVGDRMPCYCTASGKVFLAYMAPSPVEDVVRGGLVARTPNTITSGPKLKAELKRIRELGYGVDDVENEAEIRCVGAPVFGHDGQIAAAISISGPASRIVASRVPDLGQQAMAAGREVSLTLGAPTE